MLISIGPYTFEINRTAFENMTKNTSYGWQKVQRIGNNPTFQAAEKWSEEIELKGLVFTKHASKLFLLDGLLLIDLLNLLAKQMRPQIVITGYGQILGRFVILSVSEDRNTFLPTGEFLKQSYTVKLARYYN
jgi:uncharacterized protein